MTYELGRALLLTETVDSAALGDALLVASRQHLPLVRALAETARADDKNGSVATAAARARIELAVDAELANATADVENAPVASTELLARLPADLCARLGVVPLRMVDGVVHAAAADVRDRHAAEELAYWLQEEVLLIRAPLLAIERALRPTSGPTAAHVPAPASMPAEAPRKSAEPAVSSTSSVSSAPRVPTQKPSPMALIDSASVPPPVPSFPLPPPTLTLPVHGGVSAAPPVSTAAPAMAPTATGSIAPGFAAPVPHGRPASSRPPAPATTRSITPPWGTPVRRSVRPPSLSAPAPAPSHAPPPRPSERPIKSDLPPSATVSVAPIATRPSAYETAGTVSIAPNAPSPFVPAAVPRFSSRPPPTPPMPGLASTAPRALPTTRDFSGALTSGPPRPEDALEAVATAPDRDQLVDALLVAARTVATRVAIFAVRRDVFAGWTCSSDFAEPEQFRLLTVPLGAPSVLALATVAGSYFGPINRNDAHAPLLTLMGRASRDVAVVAVRASGRAALIVMADELHDTMLGTRHLEKLATIAGTSLGRLVRAI